MITCEDIEGPCCNSCHEDAEAGYENGEMCMVYDGDNIFAHVCCAKSDEAYLLLQNKEAD